MLSGKQTTYPTPLLLPHQQELISQQNIKMQKQIQVGFLLADETTLSYSKPLVCPQALSDLVQEYITQAA